MSSFRLHHLGEHARPSNVRGWAAVAFAFLVTGPVSSCTLFQSTTHVNIRPFSESTISVAGDARYDIAQYTSVYLRRHLGGPETQALKESADQMRTMIRAVIEYSVDVVAIGETDVSAAERARLYDVPFLTLTTLPIDAGWPGYPYTREQLDSVAAVAITQEKLLDALKVAQPTVEAFVASAIELADSFEVHVNRAAGEVLSGIDAEHSEEIQFRDMIKRIQLRALHDGQFLDAYVQGDASALDSLYARRPDYRQTVKNDPPSVEELTAIRNNIIERFGSMSEMLRQLEPGLDLYYNQLRELDDAQQLLFTKLRRVQLALLAWIRAHRQLANGVIDPAKIDVGRIMGGVARRVPGF